MKKSTGTSAGTVQTMDVQGNWLYLGGSFTHIAGGTSTAGAVYVKRAARLNVTTGKPDSTWNPEFDGSPIFVKASSSGDRVYFGGFMATMNGGSNTALRFVTVTATSPAAPVSGLKNWVSSSPDKVQYQQTLQESGDRLWLGGAEHAFFLYQRSDLSLIRGNITKGDTGSGGDFQASVIDGGVVYGSCHCSLSYVYGGTTSYTSPVVTDDIDQLRYVGAFDLDTGQDVPQYLPWIDTRAVRGPWALTEDTNQCLWVGGDLTRSKALSTKAWQTSGGFARFCHNDTTAPTAPTKVTATTSSSTVSLTWKASTEATSGVRYLVYRDNTVVASTTSLKATISAVTSSSSFRIRALDKAGNLSATSTAVTAGGSA
jgi:trimeric autotransporter adhesin